MILEISEWRLFGLGMALPTKHKVMGNTLDLIAHELGHSIVHTVRARSTITFLPIFLEEGFPDIFGTALSLLSNQMMLTLNLVKFT